MALTLNKTGITTGNTVEAYHVTQSIDAFTGTAAYGITLSGSLTVTGSVAINGLTNPTSTNVLTYNTTTGQIFYTASNTLGTVIDTGSFVTNSQTGSFVTNSQTGSFVTNSQTGSFVTNSQTGSYLISASTILNTIHFTSSNGSTFDVTVDTGSSGGGGSLTWVTREDADSAAYNIPASDYGIYHTKDNTTNLDNTLPGSAAIGSRVVLVRDPISTGTTKVKLIANSGQTIKLPGEGTTSTAGFIRWSGSLQRQTVEVTCVVANTTWVVTNWFPFTNISSSGEIEIS